MPSAILAQAGTVDLIAQGILAKPTFITNEDADVHEEVDDTTRLSPRPSALALLQRAHARLSAPVDVASLAAFRALFGAVLAVAAVRCIAKGWVHTQYIQPRFHFAYPHLDFVRPWPGLGMYVHFAGLAVAALGLGVRAQLCAFVVALGFSYVELLDRATYLNHYYLVCLMAWLLVLAPAGSALSSTCCDGPRAASRAFRAGCCWRCGCKWASCTCSPAWRN